MRKPKKNAKKGKSNEDILEHVAKSRGWLQEANSKAEISRTSMKEITDARAGALRAGAPTLFEKEWKKAENNLEDITASIEKGNLGPAEKKGNDLTTRYRELEVDSVKKANLSTAQENIDAAKKEGALKKAPKTLSIAEMKFDNASKLIESDPRNNEAIRRASEDATRESVHLTDVTKKVNEGNTEDLVLTAEKQQRTISSLRKDYSSTEQQLEQSQSQLSATEAEKMELQKQADLNAAASKLRTQFKPNEAEVYVENNKVMLRLKNVQFPSAKATLGPKSQAALRKVDTALAEVKPSKITVEGHTDSTGSYEKNKELSAQRAEAVEKFLVSQGVVSEGQVEAVGMGPEKPVSDNSTAQGRAQNRRIDLLIETE
ncbi:OmpA family protein [Bdellovibrio bacteriovorus]|uniref:OmpA family protein n=1 Tax=Bdellovibrio bacteriovorus TaxID=959 RepID=UPI0035A6AE9B